MRKLFDILFAIVFLVFMVRIMKLLLSLIAIVGLTISASAQVGLKTITGYRVPGLRNDGNLYGFLDADHVVFTVFGSNWYQFPSGGWNWGTAHWGSPNTDTLCIVVVDYFAPDGFQPWSHQTPFILAFNDKITGRYMVNEAQLPPVAGYDWAVYGAYRGNGGGGFTQALMWGTGPKPDTELELEQYREWFCQLNGIVGPNQ